ncbi:MAG TPA: glycosyltransferase [Pirellulales bacterium]
MKPLRIFLICQQALRPHAVPAYSFWETYFKNALTEAGHAWAEAGQVDWAEGLTFPDRAAGEQWRSRTWERTLNELAELRRRQPIDLLLAYLYPNQVDTAAIGQIRDWGIPCVNFFCDNVREFTDVPEEYRPFDLHWVPEFEALGMYHRAGLPYVHAPMPAWVPPAQRTCDHPENFGVTFIGSVDEQREALLCEALRLGARIEIRGRGWGAQPARRGTPSTHTLRNQLSFTRRHGLRALSRKVISKFRRRVSSDCFAGHIREQPVSGDDYARVTQQSRITLGINRYPSLRYAFNRPHKYSRLRDLEAPMMGACYLTENAPGLDLLYDLGQEIEVYETAGELVEKIERLSADPAKRRQLRRQGQRRALSDHTVGKSIQHIRSALGII